MLIFAVMSVSVKLKIGNQVLLSKNCDSNFQIKHTLILYSQHTNHSGGRVLVELPASTSLAPAGTKATLSSSPLALCNK